jgi:hypothetical protein
VWTITISLRASHIFSHVDTTGGTKKRKEGSVGIFKIFFQNFGGEDFFSERSFSNREVIWYLSGSDNHFGLVHVSRETQERQFIISSWRRNSIYLRSCKRFWKFVAHSTSNRSYLGETCLFSIYIPHLSVFIVKLRVCKQIMM